MLFADWIDDLKTTLTILGGIAALFGAVWGYHRLIVERVYESAVDIAVTVREPTADAPRLVFVEVTLTNKGKIKIQAKTERTPEGHAYKDDVETHEHSFSLQVRTIDAASAVAPDHLQWFKSKALAPVKDLAELNVLYEYETPCRDGNGTPIDFWMEPGESYHFGLPLVLDPGLYLGKVTFVAAGDDTSFWSRIFLIRVPPTK